MPLQTHANEGKFDSANDSIPLATALRSKEPWPTRIGLSILHRLDHAQTVHTEQPRAADYHPLSLTLLHRAARVADLQRLVCRNVSKAARRLLLVFGGCLQPYRLRTFKQGWRLTEGHP